MKKRKQIQYKILMVSVLSILSVLIIIISNYKINSLNHKKELQLESLTKLTFFMGSITSLEKDFFSYEVINPKFHENRSSIVLKKCNNTFKELEYNLKEFSSNLASKERKKIKPHLNELSKKIKKHNQYYDSLSIYVLKKGFQNFGLIGKMRDAAHHIEQYAPFDNNQEILMLRRHEKDYFLRKQDKYIIKVLRQIERLKSDVEKLKIKDVEKKQLYESLNKYRVNFNKVTDYNQLIGIKSNDGLKGKIKENFDEINININKIKDEFKATTDNKIEIINILNYIALIILIFVISISIITSKKLGLPISKLTLSMEKVIENNFSKEHDIYISNTGDEIGQLSKDIQKMVDKIQRSRQKLVDKKEEIQQQNDQLTSQKIELDVALKELAQKNKNMTSSITYAKKIQEAILPDQDNVDKIFPKNFIFYVPRDIVSGDFYTTYHKNNRKIIIAIDCTGHGVPGAFMTLLASMLINDYMRSCDEKCPNNNCIDSIFSPKKLIENLDKEIRRILKQEKRHSRDGMDMAVCVLNEDTKQLTFCGAKLPLVVIDNNELIKIKGSKRTVGGKLEPKMAEMKYEEHKINLNKGARFYMFSDGLQDQFGGPDDKKLKAKKIQEIMLNHYKSDIKDQKNTFEKELYNWMNPINHKPYTQIDDIMLLGFEV